MADIIDFPHPIHDIAYRQARIRTALERIDTIMAELRRLAEEMT